MSSNSDLLSKWVGMLEWIRENQMRSEVKTLLGIYRKTTRIYQCISLSLIIALSTQSVSAQSVDPTEVTGSDWSGALQVISENCGGVPFPGSIPISISEGLHSFAVAGAQASLAYTDSDGVTSASETAPNHTGTFSGNVLEVSGPYRYEVGSLGGCDGTGTFKMTVTVTEGLGETFASAEASYDLDLTTCDPGRAILINPCQAHFEGTLIRAVRGEEGEDLDLKGRIGGYNLKCTLKDGSTKVSGANVELLAKLKGQSEFSKIKDATTNGKGVAKFSLKKLKKGTKVRCQYGTVLSSEIKVPKLPKK